MCGRSYGNKIKLMNHVRLVHVFHPKRKVLEAQEDFKLIRKKNEMPCPTCGKIFKDSKSLKSHENTHKIWRPEDYFYCVSLFCYVVKHFSAFQKQAAKYNMSHNCCNTLIQKVKKVA